MTARSESQKPRSERANLPRNIEERSRLRAYRWLEAEAERAERQPKVKAAKASTRDQAVGEPWPAAPRRSQ
jgi:hypothetical protein